jgi:predicted transcriptional regulator YdeE
MLFTRLENFKADLYGLSTVVPQADWSRAGVSLMNQMWERIRSRQLGNKGINIWVYESGYRLFTGVELNETPTPEAGLELKQVRIARYVTTKHMGSYSKIKGVYERAVEELLEQGIQTVLPYLEVYGHWQEEESKLETDLIWTLA